MITAWQIYWVMQLDSIGGALVAVAAIAGAAAVVLWIGGAIEKACSNTLPELDISKREAARGAAMHRAAKPMTWLAAVLILVNAFIPSTKTAAAMIVLPAVANNEAIQREAGELYGIAKDALRELARPKPAKESAE